MEQENSALVANKQPLQNSSHRKKSILKLKQQPPISSADQRRASQVVDGNGKQAAFKPAETTSNNSGTSRKQSHLPPLHPSSRSANNVGTSKNKRISFSLRGQRKSSFVDIQSTIHADICPADFHKHVNSRLPDPLRLRQIIVYAMSQHLAKAKARNAEEAEAKNVMGKLMAMLLEKKLSTSWFSRPRSLDEGVVITLPNPANDELSARISGYKQVIQEIRQNLDELKSMKPSSSSATVDWDRELGVSNEANGSELQLLVEKIKDETVIADETNAEKFMKQLESMQSNLNSIRKYSAIKSVELETNFARVIEACWQSDTKDDLDDVLQPFNAIYAKAGRRLSFNLQKNDEPIKLLRALTTNLDKSTCNVEEKEEELVEKVKEEN